jgi:hypothetical protein
MHAVIIKPSPCGFGHHYVVILRDKDEVFVYHSLTTLQLCSRVYIDRSKNLLTNEQARAIMHIAGIVQ